MAGTQGRVARLLIATGVVGVFLAPSASANHDQRTIEAFPETTILEVGDTHLLTASLSAIADVASGSINIDFENEDGVNDADGDTKETPDLTCTIPAGSLSCSVSYSGTTAGDDEWRMWIDHDGRDSTDESDRKEGLDEAQKAGDGGSGPCSTKRQEPDCTDLVSVTWVSGGGEALDCDDAHGTNAEQDLRPAGGGAVSNEIYTCLVTDELGNPTEDADPVLAGIQPIVVKAEVENPVNDPDAADGTSYDTPDYTCTAGDPASLPAGTCQITLTQNENEIGTAQVCFWIGTAAEAQSLCSTEVTGENQAADGSDTGNDLSDRIDLSWEVRSSVGGGLDVEPEVDAGPLGQDHLITATVFDQFGEPFVGDTEVFFEFFKGSPSDLDEGSPETPDLTCITSNAPTCTVTFTQADLPGTDLLCAWTNEAPQMEGNNNTGACGVELQVDEDDDDGDDDAPSPRSDDIDVVARIWENPTAGELLDCFPEDVVHSVGTAGVITCKVTDGDGVAVAGAEVDVEVSGVNDPDETPFVTAPDLSCVTGADGTCQILHGPGGFGRTSEPGNTAYRAWIDDDNDNRSSEADDTEGRAEASSPGAQPEADNTDVVVKTWTKPRGDCTLMGTAGSDVLLGTSARDVICGLAGDDTIRGLDGKDLVLGGSGADEILGGSGNDVLKGGRGNDRIDGAKGIDRCSGGPGTDRIRRCE